MIYPLVNFSGIELRCGSGSSDYEPHLHGGYSIGMVTQGNQTLRTGRSRRQPAFAGCVQFHEPYQVHENRRFTTPEFAFRNIEITEARLLQLMDGQTPPPRPNLLTDFGLFRSLMQAFDALALNDEMLVQDELLTGALNGLYTLDQPPIIPAVAPGIVAQARDYLHDNYLQPVTLDSLAALTGVSRVHLSRVFKRHIGLAPHEYLIQLRIASAKTQLADGVPVAEAAALSGFADQSHLTRHFKRITHMTPGAYAQSCYKRSRP